MQPQSDVPESQPVSGSQEPPVKPENDSGVPTEGGDARIARASALIGAAASESLRHAAKRQDTEAEDPLRSENLAVSLEPEHAAFSSQFFPTASIPLIAGLTLGELHDLKQVIEYRDGLSLRFNRGLDEDWPSYQGRLNDQLCAELDAIRSQNDPTATIKMVIFETYLEGLDRRCSSDRYKDHPAPIKDAIKVVCDQLDEVQKSVTSTIAQASDLSAFITALRIAPVRQMPYLVERHLECVAKNFFDTHRFDSERIPTAKAFTDFLLALKSIGTFKDRFDDRKSGQGLVYGTLLALSHRGPRWIFSDVELRPVFRPLMESARDDHLDGKKCRNDTGRAAFVETCYFEEIEAIRQQALLTRPYPTLHMMSFSWGHESGNPTTAAKVVDAMRQLVRQSKYIKSETPELKEAGKLSLAMLSRFDLKVSLLGNLDSLHYESFIQTYQRLVSRDGRQNMFLRAAIINTAQAGELGAMLGSASEYQSVVSSIPCLGDIYAMIGARGVDAPLTRYLARQRDIFAAAAPLTSLRLQYSHDEIDRILDISNGDAGELSSFAKESARLKAGKRNPFTTDRIVTAESLGALNEVLRIRTAESALVSARQYTPSVKDLNAEQRRHVEERISQTDEMINRATQAIYHRDAGLSANEFLQLCGDEAFLDNLMGINDFSMQIPPAERRAVHLLSAKTLFLDLYPSGVIPVRSGAEVDLSAVSPEFRELREAVLKAAGEIVCVGETFDSVEEIAHQFAANGQMRDAFFALLGEAQFQSQVLIPLLERAGIHNPLYHIWIAEKSDPFSWNIPKGEDFLAQNNAAYLVISRGDQLILRAELWVSNDGGKLIVDHINSPDEFERHGDIYVREIFSYLRDYRQGNLRTAHYLAEPRFDQVILAVPTYEVDSGYLPRIEPIFPAIEGTPFEARWRGRYGEYLMNQQVID